MNNLNLNQLYTFYLVVSLKSFSKAAQRLCVTEPAISIQIKSLEDALGCQLLTRAKKKFGVTEAGRLVFSYAERLYALISELDSEIKRHTKIHGHLLALGTTKYLASTLFPPLLTAFLREMPSVSIKVEEGSSMKIVDGLVEGYYELAITGRIPYPKNLIDHTEFTSVTIYPIASPESHLTRRKLTIQDLNEEPLIVRDKHSAIRINTTSTMSTSKINPKVIIESGSTDLIKEFVKQNRGYSFLPWSSIEKDVDSGELVVLDVEDLNVSLPVDLAYLKGLNLSSVARKFLEFTEQIKKPTLEETIMTLKTIDNEKMAN